MPSTHTCLHYHLVFSTKKREPLIAGARSGELHRYLGGTVKALGGTALNVGGIADHVHLVIGLKATQCLSDVLRDIKKSSSSWMRDHGAPTFEWQEGYGAFTVSRSNLDAVISYVEEQESHHASRTFQDEYRELLERHGIAFDERYLW